MNLINNKSVIFMYQKTLEMEGILYLTDDQNKKRFVQIDIDKYGGEYLQDLIDGLVAESRKGEESVPLEEVMEGLKKAGKIDE
jgi:transcriptional regulator of NAD metabolism